MERRLPRDTVLIAGGGPIGLTLARVLAYYDVPCILFERNQSTTNWPKMDLTNARSMELFRKIGLADELRQHSVAAHFNQDVLFTTGMRAPDILTKWNLPGVDTMRQKIAETNDGTQPAEPWQRLSQAVFERWMKTVCERESLIELKYGWSIDAVEESEDCIRTTVTEVMSERTMTYVSDYVVGCDGASSKVRKSFGISVDGGPM